MTIWTDCELRGRIEKKTALPFSAGQHFVFSCGHGMQLAMRILLEPADFPGAQSQKNLAQFTVVGNSKFRPPNPLPDKIKSFSAISMYW